MERTVYQSLEQIWLFFNTGKYQRWGFDFFLVFFMHQTNPPYKIRSPPLNKPKITSKRWFTLLYFCIPINSAWQIVDHWKWPMEVYRIRKRMPKLKPIMAAMQCGWSTVIRLHVVYLTPIKSIMLAWSDHQQQHAHTKCCSVNQPMRKVHA